MADKELLNLLQWRARLLVDKTEIPFTNRFGCELHLPSTDPFDNIEFQIISCDVPGIALNTSDYELNGVNRFAFKGRTHDDLMITFYDTSKSELRSFFYDWMQKAVNIEPGNGGIVRQYFDDIVADKFKIFPLDGKGVKTKGDVFYKVFPIRIQNLNYNFSQAGEVIKCDVTFKYLIHTVEAV